MVDSTSGSGIGHDETNSLLWINDENTSNRESDSLLIDIGCILLVNHVIGICHLTVFVTNDREFQSASGYFVDVLDPSITLPSQIRQSSQRLSDRVIYPP